MRIITSLIVLMLSLTLFGQTKYCDKVNGELIIQKTYLTISYNKDYKIPNYVGYYILPKNLSGTVQRESNFYTETLIPKSCRSYTNNYSNSGYDRGHMSPAADWKHNKDAMYESFSMANVCPQIPVLNRNYWNGLEQLERKYALRCDTMYVITGQYSKLNSKKYIKNNIKVPDYFYKTCVGVKEKKVVLSIGWIYSNTTYKQTEANNRRTIENIENIIKQDLYNGFWFNGKIENRILTF